MIIGPPVLRVGAVDVPQVQAAVLLAVEPPLLSLPAITPPLSGDLFRRLAAHRQPRQPGEVLHLPARRRLRALQGVELPAAAVAVLVVQLVDPAEGLHPAVAPGPRQGVPRALRPQ